MEKAFRNWVKNDPAANCFFSLTYFSFRKSLSKAKDVNVKPRNSKLHRPSMKDYIEPNERYSQSHLGWHFESSKLKARTSLLAHFGEKRRSSFELWALKHHSKMSPQVELAVLTYLFSGNKSNHRHLSFNITSPRPGLFLSALTKISRKGEFFHRSWIVLFVRKLDLRGQKYVDYFSTVPTWTCRVRIRRRKREGEWKHCNVFTVPMCIGTSRRQVSWVLKWF